jgi:nitrogen regulatory protein PII
MTTFAIRDIQPNPFRHIDRYPVREDKVQALRESLRSTGFWDNLVAREVNGKAEIAYGHHRLVALREEFGPRHKVNLIVRDLSDEDMLQIMARENMEEWGTSAAIEHETIRAVVEAYAEGQIELSPPSAKTNASQLRYAPSFIPDADRTGGPHPYTAQTLADFLGWLKPGGRPQEKVMTALGALQLIEEDILREREFEELSSKQAQAVVRETRKAKKAGETMVSLHEKQAKEAERRAELEKARQKQAEKERRAQDAKDAKKARERALRRKRAEKLKAEAATKEAPKRAKKVGQAVAEGMRDGEGTRQAADIAARADSRPKGPPPEIGKFSRSLTSDLRKVLDPESYVGRRLQAVVDNAEYLGDFNRRELVETLRKLKGRVQTYMDGLENPREKTLGN